MTQNYNNNQNNQGSRDNQQNSNPNDAAYNNTYYSQNGGAFEQSEYVPQSYGMSNRYDDLYDYEEEQASKGFLTGVIVGGLIGAAAALFLAPKSGKDFRTDLNTHASTLKEKTSGYTDSVKGKSGGLTQQVKEQSSKVVDKVKNLKGGKSPMDDGTASSEGEESIEMLDTVHNQSDSTTTTGGQENFTSTADALREAVEEVKEESKSGSANTSGSTGTSGTKASGTTGTVGSTDSKNSSSSAGSAGTGGTSNNKGSGSNSTSNNSNKSSNSNSSGRWNNSNNSNKSNNSSNKNK
ncbi:YtxH domain-containing protein [Planomicrobium sp. CPCC 101079]|uniref:YtxH domain-containing protein n=1 Tax=Planomicrobium sp. CPCC 101079 TaxID=2599618 RepID=UPI0011B4DC2C|nr:YtxH domain-containing protein [Planomicrobium sp. CPCC 101079]TWT12478.1 YtxH domain-containing protein [Planomicrobium sp. CPCC 101079]